MRSDQYVGLNSWAQSKVLQTQKVREVGVRIHPGGVKRRFKRWVRVPVARVEVIGKIEGAWTDVVAHLHRYRLPNGKVYEEFVQATPWSSGPCYFIALKSAKGFPVRESLWSDDELANA